MNPIINAIVETVLTMFGFQYSKIENQSIPCERCGEVGAEYIVDFHDGRGQIYHAICTRLTDLE